MPSSLNRPPSRAPFDTQVDFLAALPPIGLDALRRLSELHLQLARQRNDDVLNATRALLAFGLTVAGAAGSPPAACQPE